MYKASRTSSTVNDKTFEGENSSNLASAWVYSQCSSRLKFHHYSMHTKLQIGGLQGAGPPSLKQLGGGSYIAS